jgi:hypothetical protein
MGEYSLDTQRDLVLALAGLSNFIRKHEGEEAEIDKDIDDKTIDQEPSSASTIRSSGNKVMNELRDKIAQEMWEDYCSYMGRD